ncbi:glycosyltransferase family 39 protein [Litorilinea aerophila]|nr:glycosyltransferase family 39 protein [Litorilinea aerophila]MCC9076965.1 glycosyltransferase family 39 protein [Litorilinea aerophila]
MQERAKQVFWLAVVAFTVLGFGLRLYRLEAQSLWYDEGVTADIARRSLAELTRWTAGDIQPPLYYYVVAAWGRLAGWSEWSLRFPSAFFGTLTIPLLALLAREVTRQRLAGILAAAIGAVHPLLLYYSQEARMYAMLTALGVLLGYLVVHGAWHREDRWRHWTSYVLVATAAVYTHYFAFFLLLALGVTFLLDHWLGNWLTGRHLRALAAGRPQPGLDPARPSPFTPFLLGNGAVLGLYLPWFTVLLNRLSVDSSYWEGSLKLWEALRHVAISFVAGETVLEAEAVRLLLPYGLITLVAMAALLWRGNHRWRVVHYGLLWLILPLLAILILAAMVPKFNARYAMIALPGLILLWSGGLAELMAPAAHPLADRRAGLLAAYLPTSLGLLLSLPLFLGFLYADRNWFYDPAFTKAEWRQVSQFIRQRMDEERAAGQAVSPLVVLVSGHAWPVWNYYAPDMPPLRLPQLEILDVNAVLDFAETAQALRTALRGKTDVWLVEWQHDVVDPMNLVPLQLQLAGREERIKREFWHIQLRHYTQIHAEKVLMRSPAVTPESINFGNQIYLLDYTVAANGDLLLFWQLHPQHSEPPPDLHITGNTFTADGIPFFRMEDRRPAGYPYPTFRWRPDQVTVGRIPADEWAGPGALPGTYRFRLGVYEAEGDLTGLDILGRQGQPLGKHVILDADLPQATRGPDEMDKAAAVQLIPDLFIQASTLAEEAEPGQAFGLEIHWYAEEKMPGDYRLRVRWRQRSDNRLVGEQELPMPTTLPTSQWEDDQRIRTIHQLRPPLNLAPDDYWLEVGLTAPESTFARLPFRVLGSTRLFTPPPFATPVGEDFGGVLRLLGIIEPLAATVPARDQMVFTLVWQALDRPAADYSTSIQWLGSDGKPAAQVDLSLPGGSSNWIPQQVELQTLITAAPAEPGDYRLVVVVYDANGENLPRLLTHQGRDMLELGTVSVTP